MTRLGRLAAAADRPRRLAAPAALAVAAWLAALGIVATLLLREGCGRAGAIAAMAAGGDGTTAGSVGALRAAFAPPPSSPDGAAAAAAGRSPAPLTHLVMVAGHAVFVGVAWTPGSVADEANWVLEAYQAGQVGTMVAHIQAGVAAAADDPAALLVFSGGQTRAAAGPRSEADTYWRVADAMGWWANGTDAESRGADGAAAAAADAARKRPPRPPVARRAVTEEHARDSYENLLFSVCRFAQVTGAYPARITVVTFGFKRRRFARLHRAALRFPPAAFSVIGMDPGEGGARAGAAGGGGVPADGMAAALAGEATTAAAIAADPYACGRAGLRAKRAGRNPYVRYHPYPQGCEALDGLFRHCGARVYAGPLPWDAGGMGGGGVDGGDGAS